MSGNFSFGDYFKEDAIRFAWDFLVNELGLEENRLWFSVFEGDAEVRQTTKRGRFGKKSARVPNEFWLRAQR
jgi:alanyl-tRNA synthetase